MTAAAGSGRAAPPPGGDVPVAVADEPVEVVDERGQVLAVVSRSEIRRRRLRHRTVFVAVTDAGGERLLVHRRADWKDVWPSRWDIAFGGLAGVGEAAEDAARRELAEEAGVDVALERLGAGGYDDAEVAELAEVFLARSEGPFTFADGEVVETAWVALADLDRWAGGRAVCPDSLALVAPLLAAAPG